MGQNWSPQSIFFSPTFDKIRNIRGRRGVVSSRVVILFFLQPFWSAILSFKNFYAMSARIRVCPGDPNVIRYDIASLSCLMIVTCMLIKIGAIKNCYSLRGQTLHWIGAKLCVCMFLDSTDNFKICSKEVSGFHK